MKTIPVVCSLLLCVATTHAGTINLNVDAAPNRYGSPAYGSWESDAFQRAASGNFVNMQNSANAGVAGTTYFDIRDVVVYSFGDLGKRLTWVYWLPGETTSSLAGKNFQISLSYLWAGVTYEGMPWYTPTTWMNYDNDGDGGADGVIGTVGWAWWGAYGVNTQAALDADLAAWDPNQGNITLYVRMDGAQNSLTARHPVPDVGATSILLLISVAGLEGFRRKLAR